MWTKPGRDQVSKLQQQHHDRRHVYEPQEVPRFLFVTRGDAAILLDSVHKPLHQVSFFVQVWIVCARLGTVLLRGNYSFRSTGFDGFDQRVAVVSFVCNHGLRLVALQQSLALRDVGALSRRKLQLDGQAQPTNRHMQFRGKTATRTAQRFILRPYIRTPFFAPAACWWSRITVLSSNSHSRSGSRNSWKIRAHTPLAAQRSKRRQIEFQLPNRSGRSRQGAPVLAIHRTASIKRRLSLAVTPGSPSLPGNRSLIRSQCSSEIAWRRSMPSPPWPVKNGPVAYLHQLFFVHATSSLD